MELDDGITVTGRGERHHPPDALLVTLGVSVSRTTLAAARSEAATLTDRVLRTLADGGVPERHVQTEHLSVAPEWDHRGNRPRRTGYRVTSTLRVRLERLEDAAAVLDQAVAAGGDEAVLHDVRFVLDPSPERDAEVRALAWTDAREKAEHLAELAGVRLGDVQAIVEGEAVEPPTPRPMLRAAAMAAEAGTPVAEGELLLTLDLRVRFGLG